MEKANFPAMAKLTTKLRAISSRVETIIFPKMNQLAAVIYGRIETLTLPKAEEVVALLQALAPWLTGVLIILLISGIVKAVRYRLSYKPTVSLSSLLLKSVLTYLQAGSLKSPPFSMWFGTIPEFVELYKTSPRDVHPMTTLTLLYRKYKLGDMYFSDSWPGADCMHMILNSPVRRRIDSPRKEK